MPAQGLAKLVLFLLDEPRPRCGGDRPCEDCEILFLAGQRPIVATKLRYYSDREFAGRFDNA